MLNRCLPLIMLFAVFIQLPIHVMGQDPQGKDSFFLAKKKGILGRIGRSVNVDVLPITPQKTANKFKRYNGKIIRYIEISSLDFTRKLNDTGEIRNTLPVRIAKKFHRNSSEHLIHKNLFFREGDQLSALLFADNETYLREQPYLQDAWITVFNPKDAIDSVDVIVITKDVFSIGASLHISSSTKGQMELREENLYGEGNKVAFNTLYDKERSPSIGLGGSFIKRNIKGSFINWTTGIKTFNNAFNTNRYEELQLITALEKPLIHRYSLWTGGLEVSYGRSSNAYIADSLFTSDFRYTFLRGDVWGGFNIGTKNKKRNDSEARLRHFVAVRGFYNHFYKVPGIYSSAYNYNYADIRGALLSYTVYKQNFYRTNFIYGFGRNEDVPEGLSGSIIGGYTDKQGVGRTYYGLDLAATHVQGRGSFTSYTMRTGGFVRSKHLEDVDILGGVNHFTKLREVSKYWRNRNFLELSFARQFKTALNEPLFLRSEFGLPYFRNGMLEADSRATIKLESVFFNLKKLLGFRFAPFVFTDLSLLEPYGESFNKTKGFISLGGGIRTRNENLVFGTIELKGYYFPRITDLMKAEGMKNWRVEFNTNLKFKYNSSFIRKPAFITVN